MQLYRPMLKQALGIIWRFKYLWFFGLFAALMGNAGVFNFGFKNIDKIESQGAWLIRTKDILANWHFKFGLLNLNQALASVDIWAVILILLMIVIGFFLLWLAIASQGALVYGAKQALGGRGTFFGQAIKKGSNKFWPLLLLNILLNLVVFVVLVLLMLPFIVTFINSNNSFFWQNVSVALSLIILVPLSLVLSLLMRYAMIYVVNEDKHIGQAIADAWQLFKKNWIVSLEMALVLFVLNILSGLLLMVLMVFIALPFVTLGMIASQLASVGFFWLVVALGILTFVAILFLYGAVWNAFAYTAWVVLFNKITIGGVYSKILRWAVALTSQKKDAGSQE